MITKEFMLSEMEFFLNNMRQNKVSGFMDGQEDCNFNPKVGLYNIAGKPVTVVGTLCDDKKAHRKAVSKLIKKFKAVVTITTADARIWEKGDTLKGECLIIWAESLLDNINGLGLSQPYTIDNGHLKFGEVAKEERITPIEGGLGGFFKKYH